MARRLEFADSLPAASRDAIVAAFAAGGAALKRSDRGDVVRVAAGSLPFPVVVKRYRIRGALRRIRGGLGVSPARREYRGSLALGRAGVPAVRALALFEETRGPLLRKAAVALEDLRDAPTLAAALAPASPRERRGLLDRAGALAARLHGARLAHGDLHAGNLFVARDGSLLLADLARARPLGPGVPVRAREIAFLLHSLRALGAFERVRPLRAYAREARVPFRTIARATLAAVRVRARRRADGAARHSLEPVYGREAFDEGGWRGVRYAARSADASKALAAAPADAEAWGLVAAGGRAIRIRRFPRGGARRAWTALHAAASVGLPVGQPIAWAARSGGGSIHAVETAAAAPPLPEFLARTRGRARSEAFRALGRTARRAHEADLSVGGILPARVLVETEGRPRPLLAAPLGVVVRPFPTPSARAADLEAFGRALVPAPSRADRVRVARAYDPFGHLFAAARRRRSAR